MDEQVVAGVPKSQVEVSHQTLLGQTVLSNTQIVQVGQVVLEHGGMDMRIGGLGLVYMRGCNTMPREEMVVFGDIVI